MYTYEEALQNSIEYFNGNELSAKVFLDKYALRNNEGEILENTPDKMHRRMAKEFARIESRKFKKPLTEEEIYNLFKDYKHIIPQGSPAFGIGNNYQIASISNCFVLESPEDSYGGICKTDQELVQVSKRRGGVGTDLSNLRPKGAVTNNSSRSSTGMKSWMNRYSNSIREVGQSGRRGALMLTLSNHHPDIADFITAKNNGTDVTGANISVRLTDEFLNAVEHDTGYQLRFPVESNNVAKIVSAKEIWNLIVHNAWSRAEPGILFWDNIIKESLPDCYEGFKTVSTNPCVIGSTLIATADGRNAVSIKQLYEEGLDVLVYSTNLDSGQVEIKIGKNPRLTGKNKEVWKLTLDDGNTLIATPDHKILTKNLKYVELSRLEIGQSIFPFYSFESNKYRQISNSGKKMIGGARRNRRQYRLIHEFYNGVVDSKNFAIHHKDFNSKNDNISNLEVMTHEDHIKLHSEKMIGKNNPYHKMTDQWKFNFASHPGENNAKYSGYSNEELIKHGKICFNKFGKITNKIWQEYAKENNLPQFLGNKFRFGSFKNFKNQVSSNHKVVSIEFYGYEDVYNITVDDNHNYHIITSGDNNYITSSGICVKNCGEITLSANDSCRLLVENLFYFVRNAFTPEAYFDFKAFYESVQIAQRLMDDIVDLELEKIDAIINKIKKDPENDELKQTELTLWQKVKKACKLGRRTGLGITAIGDVIAAIGIKYGSDESIEFVEKVYKVLKFGSYQSSVDMAKELGVFPIWDWEKEKNNPFLNRIKEESVLLQRFEIGGDFPDIEIACNGKQLYQDIQKYGRRNIANLTTAPVGSMSTQACYEINGIKYFNTSSGIEPLYSWKPYTRRKKGNPGDNNFRSDFVDQSGDHWMEFDVFHSGISAWMQVTGKDKIDETCPYYGASAEEIVWTQRVKLQAAAQKHVDHSISSTVNLPENTSEEEVDKIYREAWKSGCKGITVYRDNCRTGVLITKKEEKISIQPINAPKRPKELKCDIHNISVNKEKHTVIVGLLDSKPYEIFCVKDFIDKHKTGSIVKNGKGVYIIKTDDGEFSLSNYLEDDTQNALLRLISTSLRHGADIKFVVEQLQKTKGDLTSFSKCVARALKKYIQDGENSSEKCVCGSELVYQEGCLTCKSCGYSKCN